MRERQGTVYGLAVLALTASAQGDAPVGAGLLWGAIEAEDARGAIGLWESERDRYRGAVSSAGPDFEGGRQTGPRLGLDEAVKRVLRKLHVEFR